MFQRMLDNNIMHTDVHEIMPDWKATDKGDLAHY